MARVNFLERRSSIRVMGAAFVALLLFFVWLTYAFFEQKFTDFEPVYVDSPRTGVNLPENADVKLRGMIVGEVRTIVPTADGVRLTLGMKPQTLKDVPADVTAQIVPKTLFGEKYVSLIPASDSSSQSLQAGATIKRASVPIEVETVLNDLYPLLTAVDPQNLSNTLTAVSDALDGRGKELGETLVKTNAYLQKANPDVPQLVDDLVKLGQVSDTYAAAMPDLGRLLRNSVTTGNTIVAKRAQFAAFYDEGTKLSNTLTDFTRTNGDNLVTLADDSRPVLQVLGDYSPTFPCFLAGMRELIPRLDSAFRDERLNINAVVIEQPTSYDNGSNGKRENVKATAADFEKASRGASAKSGADVNASNAATPTCLDLNKIVGSKANQERFSSQRNPFNVPASVYKLVNVNYSHNKFGTDAEFADTNRPAAASGDELLSAVQPSMGGLDTPLQREALKALVSARTGTAAADVPDLASLMLSPVLQGTAVDLR